MARLILCAVLLLLAATHRNNTAAASAAELQSFTNGRGVYRTMAREFLGGHNKIRARYGVRPLSWDRALARYSRRWSWQQRSGCVLQHSPNTTYGENVYVAASGWNWRATDAVDYWAEEESAYHRTSGKCLGGAVCGHFAMMVNNETTTIGCGRAECIHGGVVMTCSYYF